MFINIKDYFYLKIENRSSVIWENGRSYWSLDYNKSPVKIILDDNREILCPCDTIFIFPPNIYTNISTTDSNRWLHTSATFYSDYEFMDRLNIPYMTPIAVSSTNELDQLMLEMENKLVSNSDFSRDAQTLYLQLILICIHDFLHAKKNDIKVNAGDDLQRLRHTIMNSLGLHWNIEMMASMANMSVRSLQRKYKQLYNTTPIADLYDFRFNKSKLLIETGYSINYILNSCGFKSVQHFSKFFKLNSGMTPSEYRKKLDLPKRNK